MSRADGQSTKREIFISGPLKYNHEHNRDVNRLGRARRIIVTPSPDRFARVAGGPRAPVHSCQCNALSRVSHAYKRLQNGHFIWRCNFV
jgi:hypothetical protein